MCPYQDCANWDNQIYDYSPGGFNFADIEILKHRFPDSPLAERIESLFPEETYTPLQEGPLLQTCEFRQP